jgi:hypothetical protein
MLPRLPAGRIPRSGGFAAGCRSGLDLERHGGRTRPHPGRIFARTARRLLALAACIWHNWGTGADDKRSLIAYDH